MASSDDEGELVAQSVTNYHFVDDKEEPVSFSVLPVQWNEDGNPEPMKGQVFLHGTADPGPQKIYKQVTAWKFELSDEHTEISVISKEKNWIKLQKPRKSFEDIVRTILITVHCLGFVKKNSKIMGEYLWDNLQKVFSTYEVRPSENDLLDHLPLICDAVKQDEALLKSKFLLKFLENPKKRKMSNEDVHIIQYRKKSKFIVDDEDESKQDVCAICDNGGDLVCCDGRCLRSFHGTKPDEEDSNCESLCLSNGQMEGNFVCANCRYKQHQCYACGKLGSSDKNFLVEVFPCVSATCGHFYHPECVAELLHPGDKSKAEKLENKIASGESFTCPAHRCHACKQSENLAKRGLRFALCRRCPKAYHRNCLPREISFTDLKNEGILTRAWDNLLPNKRVLIYCLEHEIDERIGTPVRNIIFPNDERHKQTLDPQLNKRKVMEKRKFVITENCPPEEIVRNTVEQVEKDSDGGDATKKQKYLPGQGFDPSEKPKAKDTSRKPLPDSFNSSMQLEKPGTADANRVLIGTDKFPCKGPELAKCNQHKISPSKLSKNIRHSAPLNKQRSPLSLINAETKKKIASLMEKKASLITLEGVINTHKVSPIYAYSSKNVLDKTIALGKLDVSVKAVQIALQKLEDGYSVEDAKAVCGPEILNQIIKWRNKLKVYLAPFLYGMRYSSFGRHFTKVDKLKEIVDKLHWYVQNDDVIVDFCCGANDFSRLMKEKLKENGKKCYFKNYDIIQAKNDFNFEKRDWMTVCPTELPDGSKLIMGLNPPFGVKAALANKFIDKALEFEPKLLILIVPEETERLDKKEAAYDLIWEDNKKLSGKSFYLPGSVDVNDNQMEQWNVKPPVLYLWSRQDWTAQHKAIAMKYGHLSKHEVQVLVEENHGEAELDYPMDTSPDNEDRVDILNLIKEYGGISGQINCSLEEQNEAKPEKNKRTALQNWYNSSWPEHGIAAAQMRRSHKNWKGKSTKKSRKAAETAPEGRNNDNFSQALKILVGTPVIDLPHIWADAQTPPEGRPYEARGSPYQKSGFYQHGPSITGLDNEMGFEGQRDYLRDIARRYSSPFASRTDKWSAGTNVVHDGYGIWGLDIQTHYRNEETDMQRLQLYGRQIESDYSAQRSYLNGQGNRFSKVGLQCSTPYGVRGLAADSSYGRLNSSTMQRNVPPLDELNRRSLGG